MPRGASKKREKEYDKLVHEFREERRYKGRAREVAARIVNKQRARFGERVDEHERHREDHDVDRAGPDREFGCGASDQTIPMLTGRPPELRR